MAGLRTALACLCLRWRCGYAVSPYHGVLTVKGRTHLSRGVLVAVCDRAYVFDEMLLDGPYLTLGSGCPRLADGCRELQQRCLPFDSFLGRQWQRTLHIFVKFIEALIVRLKGNRMDYSAYPNFVVEDIVRLRRRIEKSGIPPRQTDANVIVGTWNIQKLGGFHDAWTENPGSPKRNLRGLAIIAEVIKCFDVIALQEVMRDTSALRYLMKHFLGPNWAVLLTDVTEKNPFERLAYLYDTRRVTLSGLSGEIVLPPTNAGPPEQFDRTPFIAGFRAGKEHFTLLTAHIRYGEVPDDRIDELRKFAHYTAKEIRNRTRAGQSAEEPNLLVLGDFNIDERQGNPLFDAFVQEGLWVPEALQTLRTTTGKKAKHYDQIAWFQGDDFDLKPTGLAGKINFAGAVYQEFQSTQVSPRVSDHFPLWIEFSTDRSEATMAKVLGVNIDHPDPFGSVPD